ncbi:MAG TPA: guanine deaminase [Microlunatus sp.]|nr:guanine deaminase [Microlunatus sp.]
MTLYRCTILDVVGNPFRSDDPAGTLRAEDDGGLLVRDGVIVARGPYARLRADHLDEETEDLSGGLLLPGFVDTHVHYPQVRAIGGLGMPLLDWLERCALPEEALLADQAYAMAVAEELMTCLVGAGTTTALVFGSHFATAVDALFAAAERTGLRITAGQVLSDRILREDLLTTPARAVAEGRQLLERWHGRGELRYAVTPRFSLSASEPMLDACAELLTAADGVWLTSHINENGAEVDQVAAHFPERSHYLDTYHHHGLVGSRTVLAHNVHPTDHELEMMAGTGCWVAHCPTSNAALGSGLFPFRRHDAYGVGVALGSDVGAGTGFCLIKEGLQAYFAQQLLGPGGLPLTPAHLLYLSTRAGALALGLGDHVGDFEVGRRFDAVWLRPSPHSTLDIVLRHAPDTTEALAKVFALGGPADIAGVWVGGRHLTAAASGTTRPALVPSMITA